MNNENLCPGNSEHLKKARNRRPKDWLPASAQVQAMQKVMFLGATEAPEWSDRVAACRAWRELEMLRRLQRGLPSSIAPIPVKSNKVKMPQDVRPLDYEEEKAA